MAITDEVRRCFDSCTQMAGIEPDEFETVWIVKDAALKMLDRIDAAHEKAMENSYRDGYQEGKRDGDDEWYEEHESYLEEHGWYQALDADGVPIRMGDEVYQVKGGWVYTVESIKFYPDHTTLSFGCKHGYGCDSAHNIRHYHAPTVEDVLQEFARRITGRECMTVRPDIIAEYADKLQPKED